MKEPTIHIGGILGKLTLKVHVTGGRMATWRIGIVTILLRLAFWIGPFRLVHLHMEETD